MNTKWLHRAGVPKGVSILHKNLVATTVTIIIFKFDNTSDVYIAHVFEVIMLLQGCSSPDTNRPLHRHQEERQGGRHPPQAHHHVYSGAPHPRQGLQESHSRSGQEGGELQATVWVLLQLQVEVSWVGP